MISNELNPFAIFISASLINNIILIKFLGLCSFFGLSNRIKDSIGMSIAVSFVTVVSTVVSWCIYHFILLPFNLVFLRTASFILTIATLVQLEEMFIKKYLPGLYRAMGIYLPLITTNCAILAATFLNIDYGLNFINSIFHAAGIAGGYSFAIIIFATIREKLEIAPIPQTLKGYPIAFFLAGLTSLVFLGFKGLFGL